MIFNSFSSRPDRQPKSRGARNVLTGWEGVVQIQKWTLAKDVQGDPEDA